MNRVILTLMAFAAMTSLSQAQTLIGFWDFNNGSSSTTSLNGGSDVDAATLAPYLNPAVGNGSLTFSGDRIRMTTGYTENLPDPDPDGTGIGLKLQIPRGFPGGSGQPGSNNGSNLTFTLNTTGYENLVMSFAGYMAAQSFTNINIAYSVAGGAFTSFADIANEAEAAIPVATYTYDFSSIAALDNASEVAIRLTFTTVRGQGTNFIGFDNFQFNATAVPEPSFGILLGLGLATMAAARRQRKTSRA